MKAIKNQHQHYTKSLLKMLFVALSIIGLTNTAVAVDGKVYPGSNCHYV